MNKTYRSNLWRIAALLLIATMVLASCQSATPSPTTAAATQPPQVVEVTRMVEVTPEGGAATAAPAATEANPDEPVLNPDVSGEVELWHFWASPVRRNAIRRVIAMCKQKLPNITVTDTVKPFGDIWTANIAAVAGGSGMPGVIVSDRPTLPKDAADGVYMDLQEWATRDNVVRSQFYDWAWDQTLYNGDTYGIPHETDVRVLFYNKQMFTNAGLDPNKPPQTWDEVEAMADKLDKKNADGTYSQIAFMPLWNAGGDLWAYTNDGDMIAADGKPALNNPGAVETVEWIKKWVDRYGGWQTVNDYKAKFAAPPNDLFMGNAVAMYADIFGYNSQLEFYRPRADTDNNGVVDGKDGRMDWGITTLPYKANPGDWSGGFSLSIPTGAANPEAAWEFIKCATGAEGQISWARDTQAQPTNSIAANDPVLLATPFWDVVAKALSTSTGGVYLSKYPNWSQELNQRWESIWKGEKTPKEALDEAQAAVEAEVAK